MRLILLFGLLPVIFSASYSDVRIDSDEGCWTPDNGKVIDKSYANQIKFSTKVAYGKDNCSVHIMSPWLPDIQNGFGVFLTRPVDCASTVTVQCLPDSVLSDRATPPPVQYTCHTSATKIEMPCSSISLTYKRNLNINDQKKSTHIQVVPLAKGPCTDRDIFFQCSNDYAGSCIDANLHCNGRSECPDGDDERRCHVPAPAGIPVIVIILLVLAFLILICVLSTVLVCCCCRVAANNIVRRLRSGKKNQSLAKGDVTVTGEDAGLMKILTSPAADLEAPPQQYSAPPPIMIDSTKPLYPTLN